MRSLLVRSPTFFSIFKSRFEVSLPPKPSIWFSLPSSPLRSHRIFSAAGGRRKMSSSNSSAMGSVSDEQGPSRRFWIKFQKESVFALYTPFSVCLASGRLESEAFRHYVAQDMHFLRSFVQSYEMAEECADDDDDKAAISGLRKRVLEEIKMRGSIFQELGVDFAKESTLNSATEKYTSFLLATASGKVEGGKGPGKLATPFEKTKVAAYTLGAIAPCMRLFALLGKELQPILDPVNTCDLYKKWIANYASESFEAVAQQTEEVLDKLSISLTGEELEVIERLYHQAMNLKIEFFSAQPIVQQTVVPLSRFQDPAKNHLVLFSDFDLTCTVVDSSAILAEIAILTAPKSEQNGPENLKAQKSSADLRSSWNVLSRQYAEEHEQCIERTLPSEPDDAFNYEGLCKALEQLSEFEHQANSRVIESGVLKGLNLEDIKRAGERLVLRDGCTRFFQQIAKKREELNADVHILSYCWCGDLIRSAFSSGGLNVLNIHSNEFIYVETISTGEIIRKVESPNDKIQALRDILKARSENGKNLSVYVGDSVGDLLCLLEADVGIVIESSSSLRRVGSHFGVSFIPLLSGLAKIQRQFVEGESCNWKRIAGTLYTVSSWAEIHAFILGP